MPKRKRKVEIELEFPYLICGKCGAEAETLPARFDVEIGKDGVPVQDFIPVTSRANIPPGWCVMRLRGLNSDTPYAQASTTLCGDCTEKIQDSVNWNPDNPTNPGCDILV